MTKEQEEAIKYLEESILIYKNAIPKMSKTIETVLNMLKEKDKEIEKKDKIIDLMTDSFVEEGFYSEHCQTLIDNDICPDDCDKCVKQYFERKATKLSQKKKNIEQ